MCLCMSRHVQQPSSKPEQVLSLPASVVRGLLLPPSLSQGPFPFCMPPAWHLRWEEAKGS